MRIHTHVHRTPYRQHPQVNFFYFRFCPFIYYLVEYVFECEVLLFYSLCAMLSLQFDPHISLCIYVHLRVSTDFFSSLLDDKHSK